MQGLEQGLESHRLVKDWKAAGYDLAALGAGAMMPLAFAPYGLWMLAPVLLALLLALWQQGSARRALLRGWLFGIGMFSIGLSWVQISMQLYGGLHPALAHALGLLMAAVLALYPALAGWLYQRWFARQELRSLLLAAPALWVLAELLRARLLSGFPWLSLGYSQVDSALGGWASVLGVHGSSWALVVSAALLVGLYRHRKHCLPLLLLGLLLWGGGEWARRHDWTQPLPRSISVALIQGALPLRLDQNTEQLEQTTQHYIALSEPHWGVDLLIWPESVLPTVQHRVQPLLDELQEWATQAGSEFLLGIPVWDAERQLLYNSLLYLGQGGGVYHKRHLVPFGEYVPLPKLLLPVMRFLQVPLPQFSPGERPPLLQLGFGSIGTAICYEAVFGNELIAALPQAKLLVNVSNDGWFGDSIGPHQHLEITRLRALETGRYVLRATNSGISAVIDPKGRLLQQSRPFQPQTLRASLPLFQGTTPYVRWGDWAIALLSAVLCGLARFRPGRRVRR